MEDEPIGRLTITIPRGIQDINNQNPLMEEEDPNMPSVFSNDSFGGRKHTVKR